MDLVKSWIQKFYKVIFVIYIMKRFVIFLVTALFLFSIMGFVMADNETLCTDTDGGINYYEQGTIDGFDSNLEHLISNEGCVVGGEILVEEYCGEDGTIQTVDYDCTEEGLFCNDGACVNSSCTDTDGGIDYYTKGFVSTSYMDSEDSCDVNNNFLHELYCKEDGSFDVSEHSCLNEGKVCEDGACIEDEVNDDDKENQSGVQTQIQKIKQIQNRIRAHNGTGECPNECTCAGSTVKCWLNGQREMTVVAGNSGNVIVQVKGENASTNVTLYKSEGKLYGEFNNETKRIHDPEQIKEKIRQRKQVRWEEHNITLDEDGYYRVQSKKKARLFLLIPVREKVRTQVDAETGEIIKIRNPWWGFLARDMKEEPLVGASCGTVTPGYNDECCQNKGYDVWDTELSECVFSE